MFRRLRAPLVVALLSAVFVAIVMVAEGPKEMQDFDVRWWAGWRLWHRESLYRAEDFHFQFKYPPFCALGFLPLLPFDWQPAKWVWAVILAGTFAYALWTSVKWAAEGNGERPWILGLAALVLVRSFEREIANGQVNLAMLALMLGAAALQLRKQPVGSAVLAALALTMKPYAAVFAVYYLVTRQLRALLAFVGLSAVLTVVPAWFYGWNGLWEAHRTMQAYLAKSTTALLTYPTNVSFLGMYAKWFGLDAMRWVTPLALVSVAALALPFGIQLLRAPRITEARIVGLDVGILSGLIVLVSPQAWDFVVITLLPLVAALLVGFRTFGRPLRAALVASFVVLALDYKVIFRDATYAAFMRASPQTWAIVVLVVAGLLLRRRWSARATTGVAPALA